MNKKQAEFDLSDLHYGYTTGIHEGILLTEGRQATINKAYEKAESFLAGYKEGYNDSPKDSSVYPLAGPDYKNKYEETLALLEAKNLEFLHLVRGLSQTQVENEKLKEEVSILKRKLKEQYDLNIEISNKRAEHFDTILTLHKEIKILKSYEI